MPAPLSSADIEAELQEFARVHDTEHRTQASYDRWLKRKFESRVFVRRFGSFREALANYNIKSSINGAPRRTDDMIAHFEKFWDETKSEDRNLTGAWLPTEGDLTRYNRRHGHIGPGTELYRRRWGNFRDFVRAFAAVQRGEMSREALEAISISRQVPASHAVPPVPASYATSLRLLPVKAVAAEPKLAPVGSKRQREAIPHWMRDAVLRRANGRCEAPGCERDLGLSARVDHIMPFNARGRTDLENLQALCDPCNRAKSDSLVEPIRRFFHLVDCKKVPLGFVEEIAKKWRGNAIAGEVLQDMAVIAREAMRAKSS